MDLNFHAGYAQRIASLPEVDDATSRAADAVADDARRRAPRLTGEGADSIHAEQISGQPVPTYRVSWDPTFFYMRFNELGDEHQPARPFLRPAADAPAHRN